nr:putative gustatory receptor 58b [Drosophila kikkawai]
MLHPKLGRLLNLVYYHAVLFGLMGATLEIRSYGKRVRLEKTTWLYLIYSFFISSFLLLNIFFMLPRALLDGYIKYNVILQWNFFVMIGLRLLAILGCYGTIWLRRQDIIQLTKDSLIYWKRYRKLLRLKVDKRELRELQLSLAKVMGQKVFVLYSTILCSTVVQFQLLSVINKHSLLALAARLSHFLHFLAVKMGFCGLLLLLDHQFMVIHLALAALHKEKGRGKWKTLRTIARMHLETLQLARRVFRLYDLANATLFLNMFMTTVNILYHAVQYSNETIKSDGWGVIFGNGLIVFNVWGTFLLMNILDRVLSACNNVGEQLKDFSDIPKAKGRLQRELDDFALQLRRNHLVYKICGIVELDKPAGLSYIGSILSQVIILMQFDLNRQRQPNYHHQYLTQLVRNKTQAE